MKFAVAVVVAAGVGFASPTFADDAHVGVGVGPVGAGVSVGSDRGRDGERETRTMIIKKEKPRREHTTIIKKERVEPETTVIEDHD